MVAGSRGRGWHVWGECFNLKALWPLTQCCLQAPRHCNPLTHRLPSQCVMSCECVRWGLFCMCFSLPFLTAKGREGCIRVGLTSKMLLSGTHRVQEPGKVELTQFIHLSSDMCCSWVMKYTCNTMQTLPFLYCLATQSNFTPPITAAEARTATTNYKALLESSEPIRATCCLSNLRYSINFYTFAPSI